MEEKERFQKDVLTSKPPLQEKLNFSLSNSPLPLSDAVTRWRPMKEPGTTPSESIDTQHKAKNWHQLRLRSVLSSWWLTRQYFQLLIISIIDNVQREAFILEIEIDVWKCCLDWRCVLCRNSKQDSGEGRVKS